LAYILACVVYWGGQSYAPAETNVIGYITTNSAAYAQGLRVGDHIDAVNGTSVNSWEEFLVETALGGDVTLQVTHVDGDVSTVTVPTEAYLGSRMIAGVYPINHCYVLNVVPGSSAEQAGIEAGDRIVSLDGLELYSRDHLIDIVDTRRDTMVPALIERKGERIELQVKPKYDEKLDRALIGIGFNNLDVKPPLVQIKAHAELIFRLLKALMTRKEAKAAAGAVGGPVAILTVFWFAVQSSLLMALSFTCLVNVNLAVLNLLPIPVLDGGHIIFALWEMIFRKPMHRRVVDGLSTVFAVLLIALFLFLSVRDVTRLSFFSRFKGDKQQETAASTNSVPD
jgi:regulator of sigma E protease